MTGSLRRGNQKLNVKISTTFTRKNKPQLRVKFVLYPLHRFIWFYRYCPTFIVTAFYILQNKCFLFSIPFCVTACDLFNSCSTKALCICLWLFSCCIIWNLKDILILNVILRVSTTRCLPHPNFWTEYDEKRRGRKKRGEWVTNNGKGVKYSCYRRIKNIALALNFKGLHCWDS